MSTNSMLDSANGQRLVASLVACFSLLGLGAGDLSAQSHGGMNKSTPEKQLLSMGFGTSAEDLRNALGNSNLLARVFATQFIKEQNDKAFTSDIKKLLDDKESCVRVEAAMVLAPWGEAKASEVLRSELQTSEDVNVRLRAAGALADVGDSRGFGLVKATLLDERSPVQTYAATMIQKFARFRGQGIDSLAVQLQAMDIAVKKAEKKESEGAVRQAAWLFRVLAHDLEQSEDSRAVAKLHEASKSKDPKIRFAAEQSLKRSEQKQASGKQH